MQLLLRNALIANALFSALSGLALVGFGESVSQWMGVAPPWLLRTVGAGLLAFAAFLFWEARRAVLNPARALLATLADLGWVMGSVVLLLLPIATFSSVGRWTVALVAAVVLIFALLQLAGLRTLTRNRRGATNARSFFEIRRRVAAPPDVVWELVRDLDRIGEFYSALRNVEVDGEQLGARRTCENKQGQRWSEDVIEWDEAARAITLQFDTSAPDFPFPMQEMYGGWDVEEANGGTDVVVWYEYTVRGGLLGEILAPLVAQRSRSGMEATISNMERGAQRMAGARTA